MVDSQPLTQHCFDCETIAKDLEESVLAFGSSLRKRSDQSNDHHVVVP